MTSNARLRVSFVSWNPSGPPELWQKWLRTVKSIAKTNHRDRHTELVLLLDAPSPAATEQYQTELKETIEQARSELLGEDQNVNLDLFSDPQNFRILHFAPPDGDEKSEKPEKSMNSSLKLSVLEKLDLLCFAARGAYIKPFQCNPRPGMPDHSSAGARDFRVLFERSLCVSGSIVHFWQGGTADELEFASFVISNGVYRILGGFSSPKLPAFVLSQSRNLLEAKQIEGSEAIADLLRVSGAFVQLNLLYDTYLQRLSQRDRNKENSLLTHRTNPHASFPAFQGIKFSNKITASYLDKVPLQASLSSSSPSLSPNVSAQSTQPLRLLLASSLQAISGSLEKLLSDRASELRSLQSHCQPSVSFGLTHPPSQASVLPDVVADGMPPATPTSLSGATGSRQSGGSNIVSFSAWWKRRKEEREQRRDFFRQQQLREHETLQSQARYLRTIREGEEEVQSSTDADTGWEIVTIIFWTIFIALLVVSISLSAVAIHKLNRIPRAALA